MRDISYASPVPPPEPGLRQSLHSLGCTQLLKQSQLATTYDAQALGTMAFDAAFATLVVSSKAHAYLWALSLAMLVVSVLFAAVALLASGAEDAGPDIKDVLGSRGAWADDVLETQIVEDLRVDITANEGNLAAKTRWAQRALVLLIFALGFELLGQL